jgi:hypothetical protein
VSADADRRPMITVEEMPAPSAAGQPEQAVRAMLKVSEPVSAPCTPDPARSPAMVHHEPPGTLAVLRQMSHQGPPREEPSRVMRDLLSPVCDIALASGRVHVL